MTKKRGIKYLRYIGVTTCTKCGKRGYLEEWQSYLTERYTCFTVQHKEKQKTVKRCWLFNQ